MNTIKHIETIHPKGAILLFDGDIIMGMPKVEEVESCDNLELFTNNAFFLFARREQILRDSRMFLTPVPVENGLMYTATSGFDRPTLGVYIEWWMHCREAVMIDDDGKTWLTYKFCGSPLSGINSCHVVDDEGLAKTFESHNFKPLWQSFMRINERYTTPKKLYQAYSLEQVINELRKSGSSSDF